jgi:N-acetyl-alpha-D-muramate 1-phosphate uridylyltransferase
MQIAILAGGLATRLGDLAKSQPKSLIRIRGKPFLEYQLEFLKRGGIEDIVLCIGHLGEHIEQYFGNGKKYGVKIRYSREDKLLGTAGAFKRAEALLNDPFFIMFGDSFVSLSFSRVMSYFRSWNKLALMTVYRNYDRYDRSNTEVKGNLVTKFSKKQKTRDMVYVEYGVDIFRKEVLNMVPTNENYSLDDLFQRLVAQQELLAFEVNERFYEIGSLHGLKEFEQLVKGGAR